MLTLAGCSATAPEAGDPRASADLAQGRAQYEIACAACHGVAGAGTSVGPPLVHPLYNPGHHRDSAFRRAIAQGVTAHHWPYGDMPPVPRIPPDEAQAIIRYVRALQRAAGIY